MGEKWPVSQQPPANNAAAGPATLYAWPANGASSIQETRVKGHHGPLDISYDNTPGYVMWGGVICIWEGREWWERTKKVSVGKDWKAKLIRSLCRSSVSKSIRTIQPCVVNLIALNQLLDTPTTILLFLFLRRSPLWLSIIKEDIWPGAKRKWLINVFLADQCILQGIVGPVLFTL